MVVGGKTQATAVRRPGPAEGAAGRAEPAKDGQTVDVRARMEFKTHGGRKEIVLPPGVEPEPVANRNRPLVLALARAHRWQGMLDSDEVSGVEALARQHGVDRTYVSRILGLAMLAPDLAEAAVKGDEASGLSLRKLMARSLPGRWDQQRASQRG